MSVFGVIPAEPLRQTALDLCAPKFAQAVFKVLAEMQEAGFDPQVYETLRTKERQDWLAGFGREYDDGRGIITHATSVYTTWHGFGCAADIISYAKQWDASANFWDALSRSAIAHGLASGASWQMKDLPHIQIGPPARTTPSVRARQLLDSGGLIAVWQEVGWAD
jgi:hypothetical protein